MSTHSQPSNSLYVGDLAPEVSEGLLFEQFSKVGPVASIRVCRDSITRDSLGYAYVNFQNSSDADRALDTMNYTLIKGRPCRIMWSQRDPALRKSGLGNIFVKKLSEKVDNKILFDHFSVSGNILSCKVAIDKDGKSKGYGYVHYETNEAAEEAILKFNGQTIEDQVIQVEKFLPKSNRKEQDSNNWTNVIIKNIPAHWNNEKLNEVASAFGTIQSAVCKSKEYANGVRYFAFVNFHDHQSAVNCQQALNEQEHDGCKLIAQQALTKTQLHSIHSKPAPKTNLYVRNFDDNTDDEQLHALFSRFGPITSARVMKHPIESSVPHPDDPTKTIIKTTFTGPSKGFGFVNFKDPVSAQKALEEMNGFSYGHRRLNVFHYQSKQERQHTYANRNRNQYQQQPMHPGMPFMPPPMYPYMGGGGGGRPYSYPYRNQHFPQRPQYPPRNAPFNPQYYPPQYGMGYNQPPMQQQPPFHPSNPNMRQSGGAKRPPIQGQQQPQGQQGQGQNQVRPKGQRAPQQMAPQQTSVPVQPVSAPAPVAAPVESGSMSYAQTLANMDPQEQKNSLGEALYPMIYNKNPHLAGKITGMLLEMDNAELVNLLESPDALNHKVEEALTVLRNHGIQ